jgi:molecular chaperone GrpE
MTESELPEPNWDDALEHLVEELREAPVVNEDGAPEVAESPIDLVAERTADLQRLQAEYANYKKRVDRDRARAREGGIEAVLTDLLPVLDGIEAARAHDELTGGAKLLADELAKVTGKYGLTTYGAVGDAFDPHIHEALMTMDRPGYAVTSVAEVFQPGYEIKDRILRPARVGVAQPTEPEASDATGSDTATLTDEPVPPSSASPLSPPSASPSSPADIS